MSRAGTLTPQQVAFFDAFGFLKLPGLLRDDIDAITAAFEEVFADERQYRVETHEAVHGHRPRVTIPLFVERHPTLAALKDDPRIRGIAVSLVGEDHRYAESDGNVFQCETFWHADVYGAKLQERHIKVSLYLDPVNGDSGALRFVPGSHYNTETFSKLLRAAVRGEGGVEAAFGVRRDELPAWTVDSEPGDVVVGDFRTFHATFNGIAPRRHLSMNFREWSGSVEDDEKAAAALEKLKAAVMAIPAEPGAGAAAGG